MTCVDESIPRSMPVTASKSNLTQEGLVLKKGSGDTLELIVAKGDAAVAVLDQAFVDSTQTTKTTATGDQVGVFFLGSGNIVRVASVTGVTYAIGDIIYLDDSTDGMVNKTAATSTPIGHYVGTGETTTANGDLINVNLDYGIDSATV